MKIHHSCTDHHFFPQNRHTHSELAFLWGFRTGHGKKNIKNSNTVSESLKLGLIYAQILKCVLEQVFDSIAY